MSDPFVYALDFDGVICDSANESSRTALLAAKAKWPHLSLPSQPQHRFPQPLVEALRTVRPVIETGYENVILGRLVAEADENDLQNQFIDPVMDDWPALRDNLMTEWELDKDELISVFGGVRDGWINDDLLSWLNTNKLYVFLSPSHAHLLFTDKAIFSAHP